MQPQPGRLCPNCRVDLVMTDRQEVKIDYCPKCRGVWLDRGELDKIIARSAGEAPPTPETPRPSYDRSGYDEDGYHPRRRKRKSFLSEMFDFG